MSWDPYLLDGRLPTVNNNLFRHDLRGRTVQCSAVTIQNENIIRHVGYDRYRVRYKAASTLMLVKSRDAVLLPQLGAALGACDHA